MLYNLLKWVEKELVFDDTIIVVSKPYVANQVSIFVTGAVPVVASSNCKLNSFSRIFTVS